MLQVRDLYYSIGARDLLAGIDLMIHPGKRVALIGPNGAGKTTLLKILHGDLESGGGTIIKPRDFSLGYLPQEEVVVGQDTVFQTVMEGQTDIAAIGQDIRKLLSGMDEAGKDQENLVERFGVLEQKFEALGGYRLDPIIKNILTGLGFSKKDFFRPLAEFSGGFRMRVYLAMLLVRQPDILLLDEPTNHLDIPSLEWLEQYLLNFPGSILLVSHDRFFIDRLAEEIVELDRGQLVHYAGNYHFYEAEKEKREQLLHKKQQEIREERERQERFIDRFRYTASKASSVQSRIKMLEKMEDIDIPPPPPRLHFSLSVSTPSYKEVIKIQAMSFAYEKDSPIFQDIDLAIFRHDKLALVGPNGAGKTTLTRLIAGELTPTQGLLVRGEKVTIGYYAQHQVEVLNLEATVYDEVMASVATSQVPHIRDVLGIFQFSGNDVYKPIKVLSGGEKARVSLCKILLSPANFLIMDEPTTHLDKAAREALEHALSGYNGTLLVISHDRYFLDKLVHRVIEPKAGRLEEYHGNYSHYLEKRQARPDPQPSPSRSKKPVDDTGPVGGKKSKEQKRLEAEARQAVSKDLNRLRGENDTLEERISRYEERIKEIETLMTDPGTYDDKELTVALQKEYADSNRGLTEANKDWEEVQGKLEEIEALLPQSSRRTKGVHG